MHWPQTTQRQKPDGGVAAHFVDAVANDNKSLCIRLAVLNQPRITQFTCCNFCHALLRQWLLAQHGNEKKPEVSPHGSHREALRYQRSWTWFLKVNCTMLSLRTRAFVDESTLYPYCNSKQQKSTLATGVQSKLQWAARSCLGLTT